MLTKRDVEKIEPNSIIWDEGTGAVPGLCVRRQKGETRSFSLRYRDPAGRQRWISLGTFGRVTVEEARKAAKKLAGEIANGADPRSEANERRRRARTALSVAELCDAYMRAAEAGTALTRFGTPKKASTLATDQGRIARHIKPLLGELIVDEVTPAQIAGFIEKVTLGATAVQERTGSRGLARVTGGAGTATRTANLLGAIFAWGRKRGLVAVQPVHGVERARDAKRDRFLSAEEYRSLGEVLDRGTDHMGRTLNPMAVQIARALALTGARRGEIEGLRWVEVDFSARCVRLENTKTGRSIRPMGAAARDLLRTLERTEGCAWIFPARRGDGFYQGAKREFETIARAANLPGVTAHTLRHSFASVAAELGYADAVIGAMLGHAGRGVTSRYIHAPDAVLVAAADRVADEIARRMGVAPETGAIIPLRRA